MPSMPSCGSTARHRDVACAGRHARAGARRARRMRHPQLRAAVARRSRAPLGFRPQSRRRLLADRRDRTSRQARARLRRVALAMGIRIHERTPMLDFTPGQRRSCARRPAACARASSCSRSTRGWRAASRSSSARSRSCRATWSSPRNAGAAREDRRGRRVGARFADLRLYYRTTADGRLMLGKGGNTFSWRSRIAPCSTGARRTRRSSRRACARSFRRSRACRLPRAGTGRRIAPSPASVLRPLRRRAERVLRLRLLGQRRGAGLHGRADPVVARARPRQRVDAQPDRARPAGFPPEPIRYVGAHIVRMRSAARSARRTSRPPATVDTWLAKFASAAGKADKA